MKIAFCLFEYFPFGGLQRDCYRIAEACAKAGAEVEVITRAWDGDRPEHFCVTQLPTRGITNAGKIKKFARLAQAYIEKKKFDKVVGFSKMPGLDYYYAADPCYIARAGKDRPGFYRYTSHYRAYSAFEKAVFSPESDTKILMISPPQQAIYESEYQTPSDRFIQLPPGILRDRCAAEDYELVREEQRREWSLTGRHLVLMVGSGFKTKGLDRALNAVAALPEDVKAKTEFWVAGQDNEEPYRKLIKQLNLENTVFFLGGRNDIPQLLNAADCLIHPAYSENTGTILLEAAVAGLPVLCSENCGYASYIEESQSGIVIPQPFEQDMLDKSLLSLLEQPEPYRSNGIQFGKTANIYSMVEKAQQVIMEKPKRKHASSAATHSE